MSATYLHCGLFDPARRQADLLNAVLSAPSIPLLGASVHDRQPEIEGALVDVRIEFDDLRPSLRREWRTIGTALAGLIPEVSPAIAAVGFADPWGLAAPTWPAEQGLFEVGWVRLCTLTTRQSAAFGDLESGRLVRPLGPGLTWGPGRMWSLTDGFLRDPGPALAAAVFTAWTGQAVEPAAPTEPVEEIDLELSSEDDQELDDINLPQLWFWHHDLDEDELVARVTRALPHYQVWYDPYDEPRWRPIIATPPEDLDDQLVLLDDLRRAVTLVEPDWAALQPDRGVLVPGLDPEMPASGILDHPWVNRAWIGNRLTALTEALAPAPAEDVGDGVLFVTAKDPRHPGAQLPVYQTREQRWDAIVTAATILGDLARTTVDGPR